MEAKRHKKSLAELLAKCDPNAPQSAEARDWDNMAPVGREFGSPDYERLAAQDHAVVQSNLAQLIEICRSMGPLTLEGWQIDDAFRIQSALRELGQQTNTATAALVWLHHSQAVLAGWLSGADTIESAKEALYSYCLHAPQGGFVPEPPGPIGPF